MVKYNFDKVINRKGTSCIKYDAMKERMGRTDLLPMWVADMEFPLPKVILDELHKRIDHGIFGYTDPDQSYFDAINHWFGPRHGYTVKPEEVTLGPGTVYGLATGVQAFTKPGDSVLIQQPVYYPFAEVIQDNNRKLVNNELRYQNGKYTIDFQDFEQKIINNDVKVFILCSPHNPVGRVWTRNELIRMADICLKHHVIILSDEIHCDFVFKPHKFTSMFTLGAKYQNNLVVYCSPSKSFNIAGFQPANIMIPNPKLRKLYRKANTANGYSQGSLMGQAAVKACYNKGGEWFDQVLQYITHNLDYMRKFLKENLPTAKLVEPEGTYLIWVDFSGYGLSAEKLDHVMIDEAHLWLDKGSTFGPHCAQFERFNIACPRSILKQCLTQLRDALDKYEK